MRSFLAGLRRLVIPWGAAADQPRIVLATDDPLARAFSDAAASFYYDAASGFVVAVDKSGTTTGIFRIAAGPADGTFAERIEYLHAERDTAEPLFNSLLLSAGNLAGATTPPELYLTFDVDDTGAVGVLRLAADAISLDGDVTVGGGAPLGRGQLARSAVVTAAPYPTAGTANTLLFTTTAATFRAGRAYEVHVKGRLFAPATTTLDPRIRKGAASTGPVLINAGQVDAPAGAERHFHYSGVFITGAADVTTELSMTGQTPAGTVEIRGTGQGPAVMTVTDVGTADDYPGHTVLA